MKLNKQSIIYIMTIFLSILFIIVGNKLCRPQMLSEGVEDYYRAKVVSINNVKEETYYIDAGYTQTTNKRITFSVKMNSGPYKGDTVEVVQDINDMYGYNPREVKKGDSVLVTRPGYDFESGAMGEDVAWVLAEYNRVPQVITLIILFLLLVVLIGRKKGISTIVSLAFTVLSIFLVYIPSILKGYNIYLMTIIVSLFIIFMSLIVINGWNKKTMCAMVGNVTGIAVAGILAIVMHNVLGLTGMSDEDNVMLWVNATVDIRAVLWGGLLIGALGAIMDVAMSIASAMQELNDTMRDKSFVRMLSSGMNIGRDAIGTMTNTLILAYIGGAMATVLLKVANNKNIYFVFNMETIICEIVCSVVGSIGILAAVPATAFISAYVFNRDGGSENKSEN